MRTHVIMPKELVETIDELVGRRARSKFLVDAAEKEVRRLRLARLARDLAGSLKNRDIPGWETSDSAARWVHDSRQADQLESEDRLRGSR